MLITASTPSNGPIDLAAAAVRKKGRVVLVGVVGLELDRRPFYFKEAEFVVSCSYGPGPLRPRIRRSRPRLSGGLCPVDGRAATCKPCWS